MIKQVIIIRKDLNMRKGKMVAQGCHASLGAYNEAIHVKGYDIVEWDHTGQTKICVGVDSESELLMCFRMAKAIQIPAYLVLDAGRTEFKEPTHTAVAIGPASEELINPITGLLKLL